MPPVRYRIQENRILKNGELRYFDHPKFGVLAKVTRVEDEEEDARRESNYSATVPSNASRNSAALRFSFAASATATSKPTVTNFDDLERG